MRVSTVQLPPRVKVLFEEEEHTAVVCNVAESVRWLQEANTAAGLGIDFKCLALISPVRPDLMIPRSHKDGAGYGAQRIANHWAS